MRSIVVHAIVATKKSEVHKECILCSSERHHCEKEGMVDEEHCGPWHGCDNEADG